MVTKKHFWEQMNKLMVIFNEQVPVERIAAYYDAMSADFTDEQFDVAVNVALKNSFKFPPIAAFYKGIEPEAKPFVPDPVTPEEAAIIREVLSRD